MAKKEKLEEPVVEASVTEKKETLAEVKPMTEKEKAVLLSSEVTEFLATRVQPPAMLTRLEWKAIAEVVIAMVVKSLVK